MSSAATTASATLTSRADSNSDGSGSGTFLSSGGSTLILAFLAIGLFIGGLLVMFSMRRYVVSGRRRIRTWQAAGERGWDWDETQVGPATIGGVSIMMRRRRDFGSKPELWDCRFKEAADSRWASIQPIAAKLVYEDPALPSVRRPGDDASRYASSSQNPSVPSISPPGFFHPFHVGWRDFTTQLPAGPPPPSLFHSPASPLTAPSTPGRITEDACLATSAPPAHLVHVVVAVTMPTEKPCVEGVPLFALGIADVPWNGSLPEDPHESTPYG